MLKISELNFFKIIGILDPAGHEIFTIAKGNMESGSYQSPDVPKTIFLRSNFPYSKVNFSALRIS